VLSIREECNPRTTTNPIVETYLEEVGRSKKMVVRKYWKRKGRGVEKERSMVTRTEQTPYL